ncbi:acyltransferase family protein [Geodermatophilus sp. SYSU D01062]
MTAAAGGGAIGSEAGVHGRFLPSLDGLRAVAALLVVGYHAAPTAWPLDVGWAGVPVFFVLSGYLITRLSLADEAGRGFSFRSFWIRRVTRILPLYLLAVGAFLLLPFLGEDGGGWSTVRATAPYYLTFNGEFVEHGPMTVAWSLGIEEKFYLLWPVVAFALFAGRARRLHATAGAAALGLVVAVLFPVPHLTGYAALLVGAAVAFLERRRGWVGDGMPGPLARPAAGWAAAVAVVAVLLAANLPDDRLVYLLLCPAVGVLLLHLVHGRSAVARVLGAVPMRWIGRRSYGIYLVHTLALTVCEKLVPASVPARGLWAGIGCLVLTLVLSDAAHRLVEAPFLRLGRQWSARRDAPRSPAHVAEVAA